MGDLAKNLSRSEIVCPCCGSAGIAGRLVSAFQDLRDLVDVPVWVTSGVRCHNWNKVCGGSARSQHLLGRAADIVVQGFTVAEMAEAAEKVEAFRHGGIGTYPDRGFIHVDVRAAIARWTG